LNNWRLLILVRYSGPDITFSMCSQQPKLQPVLILLLISLVQVRGTIEKELGKPMSDLFADFVLDPLATASVSAAVSK